MYKIYKIKNKKNPSEIYVGSTKQTLNRRFQSHAASKGSACYQYILRDGKENFEIIVIDYAENKKDAIEKEIFWTLFLKEQGYFMYNRQVGTIPTEEIKEKNRIANTGKHPTEETRRKISEANKGKNHPLYGKHHTEETKAKISKANKGRLAGENHPLFGKHLSDETKAKISETKKKNYVKENNPFYNRHVYGSNHPRARKIRCIDDNKIFNCIKDAADFYNIGSSAIINNCKKKSKSCAGFHFEYV